MHKTSGFTLAEVLITLGIIGVVAALTLPNLIANYQKKELNTRFAKVYSTYSNALVQIIEENGDVPECYYFNGYSKVAECESFFKNYIKKLNIVKYCDKNGVINKCIPEYTKYNAEDNNAACPGFKKSIIETISKSWVLPDGSTAFTYYNGSAMPVFAIDINGFQKPNKGGYDLFSFTISRPDGVNTLKLINSVDHCQYTFVENGGMTTNEMLTSIYK